MEPGPINHAPATGFPKPRPWALLRGGVLVGRIANLRRPALRLSSPARSLGCIRAYLANRRATVVLRAPIPGFATRLELDGFNVRTGHDVMATLISQSEGGHRELHYLMGNCWVWVEPDTPGYAWPALWLHLSSTACLAGAATHCSARVHALSQRSLKLSRHVVG